MLLAFFTSGCPPSELMAAWIIFTISSLKSNYKKATEFHINGIVSCTATPSTNSLRHQVSIQMTRRLNQSIDLKAEREVGCKETSSPVHFQTGWQNCHNGSLLPSTRSWLLTDFTSAKLAISQGFGQNLATARLPSTLQYTVFLKITGSAGKKEEKAVPYKENWFGQR